MTIIRRYIESISFESTSSWDFFVSFIPVLLQLSHDVVQVLRNSWWHLLFLPFVPHSFMPSIRVSKAVGQPMADCVIMDCHFVSAQEFLIFRKLSLKMFHSWKPDFITYCLQCRGIRVLHIDHKSWGKFWVNAVV